MTEILSVSVSGDQKDWLQMNKKRKDCSPTFLLRKAINEKQQEIDSGVVQNSRELQRRLDVFHEMAMNQRTFIEKRGLLNEFLESETHQ